MGRNGYARGGATLYEIEAVYRAELAKLRRVAAAILGDDREAASDAVQDAFAIAVRSRATYERRGPLGAWIWRIVVNAAHERRRRDRSDDQFFEDAPTAVNASADHLDRLRLAVALLPERQRLVLFLRYYADLDYDSIATIAGIAPGTVAATLNAARTSVRRRLEEVPR